MKSLRTIWFVLFGKTSSGDFTTHQAPPVPDFWKEWEGSQFAVATEEALAAAVDLIQFQAEVYHDLVNAVNAAGLEVTPSPDAMNEYVAIMKRWRAAVTVAREVLGWSEAEVAEMLREQGESA